MVGLAAVLLPCRAPFRPGAVACCQLLLPRCTAETRGGCVGPCAAEQHAPWWPARALAYLPTAPQDGLPTVNYPAPLPRSPLASHPSAVTRCSVLDAYPFLDRAAAFIYDSGLAAPNVAKLARAAARRGTPAMLARAIRMSMAADGGGRRRRLWTEGAADAVAAAAAAEGTQLAAEAGGSDGSGDLQQESEQRQQQQQLGQQQQIAHAAAASGDAPDSLAAGSAEASSAGIEAPPPGSYAAALLAAFDDDAVRAARRAARQLKAQLMQHNLEVAGALLAETAAAAAALAA